MAKQPLDMRRERQERLAEHQEENQQAMAEEEERLKALEGPVEDKSLAGPAENKQASILTVDFASAAAAEYADDHDLTDADFDGMEPSGKTGYTKADAVAAKEARR